MSPIEFKFSRILPEIGLSFQDIVLEPALSSVTPKQADLQTRFTRNISLKTPFVVKNATYESAVAAAQMGSIGIISCDMSISKQADIVRKIKRAQSRIISNVITVPPEASALEMAEYKARYDLDVIPVVESSTQMLAGYVRVEESMNSDDPNKTVGQFISSMPVITLPHGSELSEVYSAMKEHDAEYIALIDKSERFVGLVTKADKETAEKFPQATINEQGNLLVAACVGTGEEHFDRVTSLIDAGVDVIVVDAAHGHGKDAVDMVTFIRRQRTGHVEVIAGNVVTTEAALALIDAGADGVKVKGDFPAITALLQVTDAATLHNVPVYTDLAIDDTTIAKAFAAGTSYIGVEVDDKTSLQDTSKTMETALRLAMSHTGCTTLREFNTRPRFVKLNSR